jgi:hypothetical protein
MTIHTSGLRTRGLLGPEIEEHAMTMEIPSAAGQPFGQPAAIQAGWYPDPHGVMRFWDGRGWTEHAAPPPPPLQHYAPAPQVMMQAPYQMVTTSKKHTSHGLHLFLTIVTGGAWGLLVWLPITIFHKSTREKSVTRVGY